MNRTKLKEKPIEKDDLSKILRYIIGCLSYIIGIKVPKDIEKALNNIERRNK